MGGKRLLSRLGISAAALAAAALLSGANSGTAGFDQRVLNAHNYERETLGLPALNWNPRLAADAQQWADYLAATRQFEHSEDYSDNPQGENLWMGTRNYYSPEAMVSAWVSEKRYFRPGRFPYNSKTGDIDDVGHYTQLVWRATGQVGCARAANRHDDFLVCRYSRAGNTEGERPF